MSVIIYTYRDPYKLKENKELWRERSSCPYFCVAQTLVNGLKAVYGAAFQIGRVTTVKNLTDCKEFVRRAIQMKQKSYLQYLRSFVNRGSEDKTCSVELEFEIDNGIKENYIVRREWDAISKRTKEQIFVYKDGTYSEFLTNNWPMFVENILPSALSSFFFFDGEKIAELAVDSTNIQLKNSIRMRVI